MIVMQMINTFLGLLLLIARSDHGKIKREENENKCFASDSFLNTWKLQIHQMEMESVCFLIHLCPFYCKSPDTTPTLSHAHTHSYCLIFSQTLTHTQ